MEYSQARCIRQGDPNCVIGQHRLLRSSGRLGTAANSTLCLARTLRPSTTARTRPTASSTAAGSAAPSQNVARRFSTPTCGNIFRFCCRSINTAYSSAVRPSPCSVPLPGRPCIHTSVRFEKTERVQRPCPRCCYRRCLAR